jgi:TldD protein
MFPVLSSSAPPIAWSRRAWLGRHAALLVGVTSGYARRARRVTPVDPTTAARAVAQAIPGDPAPWQALAHQGVEAARAAGAQYADVRLTRTCGQKFAFGSGVDVAFNFAEITGVGVRALVNGTWGFAACPWPTAEAVVGVARDAVAQASVNGRRQGQPVEWVPAPVAQGMWATPVKIDPFAVTIEEKRDYLAYIQDYGDSLGITSEFFSGAVEVHRQERVLATSEGSLVTRVGA